MINKIGKMNRIRKIVCFAGLTCAVALTGCARTEPGEPSHGEDDMFAVELAAAGGSVQVSRAADMNAIENAIVLVWDAAGTTLLHNRYLDYAGKERVYLRAGTYQIFAVANLTDENCPNGSVATYLSDVAVPADLNGKHLIATSSTPGNLIMCSGVETTVIANNTDDKTIVLRRVQTKINLNIYNKISGQGGSVASGVEMHSYYTDNLPKGSYLIEQPATDNPSDPYDYPGGYERVYPTTLSNPTEVELTSGNWYHRYNVEIITFENRRGTIDILEIASAYDRKEKAPDNALEINVIGYANGAVLDTFVLPGKGRSAEPNYPDMDNIANFDVDRNCIYHINVIINNTANIDIDSRREYLELAVCGDLNPPVDGTGAEF